MSAVEQFESRSLSPLAYFFPKYPGEYLRTLRHRNSQTKLGFVPGGSVYDEVRKRKPAV